MTLDTIIHIVILLTFHKDPFVLEAYVMFTCMSNSFCRFEIFYYFSLDSVVLFCVEVGCSNLVPEML